MDNEAKVELSSNNELSKYSSAFIKKGLDLLKDLNLDSNLAEDDGYQRLKNDDWKCVYTLRNFSDLLAIHKINVKKHHHSIAISPNGHFVASVDRKGDVKVFNLITQELCSLKRECPLKASSPRHHLYISSNGTVVCVSDKEIETWLLSNEVKYNYLPISHAGSCRLDINLVQEVIAYYGSARFDVCENGNRAYRRDDLKVLSLDSNEILCVIDSNIDDIQCISVNCDANKIAVSGYRLLDIELDRYEEDDYFFSRYSIEVWDLNRKKLLYDLDVEVNLCICNEEHENDEGGIYDTSVIISADGKKLIGIRDYIGIPQACIKVWDLKNSELIFSISEKANFLTISSSGRILYLTENNIIRIRDLESGNLICEIASCSKIYYEVITRGNDSYLVTGGEDGIIRIWDIDTGNLLHILAGHDCSIKSIISNSSGSLIATTDLHGETKLWSSNAF
ncbi:WD40 repeat domain-containing protein [Nodosilinea sp. AN01ver1]|uniref:WD40 repeat domain-containing protein n=1 Tax=Nodosilinea sp. AN01ver1 TaxID=3423362 RepID=UPI003D31E240